MAAGRASTLLIRIVGDSTGATTALNQVATASAAAAEVVDESGEKMSRSTKKQIAALEAQQAAAMQNLRVTLAEAEAAEEASQKKLKATKQELVLQKQQLKGMRLMDGVSKESIKTKQREIYIIEQMVIEEQRHTASLVQNVKAMKLNVEGLEKLQREQMDSLTGINAQAGANKKLGKSWMGVAGAVAAAATVSIKAAVDLESANAAVSAIWGEENTAKVMEAADAMTQYGLSQAQAAQAAAILGAQLMNAGVPMEEAARMTEELITLSVGLANTFGTTVPQALTALSATFRNEFDSIEKYGVAINEAAVDAQILAMETAGATFATEKQAEVMAIYTLIMQQTTGAMDSLNDGTMTTREAFNVLKASTTELAAELGGYLLPILTPIFDALGSVLSVTGDLIDENGLLAKASEGVTQVLEDLWQIIEPILIPALERLDQMFQRIADFLDTYVLPVLDRVATAFQRIADAIGAVIDGIVELIDWIDELWTRPMEETAAMMDDAAASGMAFGTPTLTINRRGTPSTQAKSSGNTYITIQAGVGDPHAIAKEIRRVLRQDQVRMGRVA